MKTYGFLTWVGIVIVGGYIPAGFTAGKTSFSTGVHFSSGKYGETTSTDMWYIPFTIKHKTDNWIFKLTVPYLSITGPGNVVRDVGQVNNGAGGKTTVSGLGDVVTSATYSVYENAQTRTYVDLTGKLKFGTADKDKSLGTGEEDVSAEVSVYKVIHKNTLFGTLGYKAPGDTPTTNLRNVFYTSLGVIRTFSSATSAGLFVDYKEKTTATNDEQRSATVFMSHKLDRQWSLQFYGIKGFTDSTPDWSGGGMVKYTF